MEVLKDSLAAVCGRVAKTVTEAHVFNFSPMSSSPTMSVADIIQPYLAFHGMKTFHLDCGPYHAHMNDQDALAFASAWPSLKGFHFDRLKVLSRSLDSQDQVTVAGLLEFAQRCPRLAFLSLPTLDVRSLPPTHSVPLIGLETLAVL